MKKLFIMAIIVFFALSFNNVLAFDFEYRTNKSFLTGPDMPGQTFESGVEHEIRLSVDNVFLWGSIENFTLYSNDQNMKAFGLGLKYPIKNFTVWIKGGYYMPESDQNIPWEAGWLYHKHYYNKLFPTFKGDHYAITLDNNVGFETGIDFKHEIIKNLDFGLSISYRALAIYEHMDAWKDGQPRGTSGWISEMDRDFSCVRGGVFLTYHF